MQLSGHKGDLLSWNRRGAAVTLLLVITSSVSGWMVYSCYAFCELRLLECRELLSWPLNFA
jgi:hypothetical protein